MNELISEWRGDGLTRDLVEFWVVGYPGQDDLVPGFAAGSEIACFVDTPEQDAFGAYGARANDLFVIDADGVVVETVNLGVDSLGGSSGRSHLDALVRELVAS